MATKHQQKQHTSPRHFRQGDILLLSVNAIPADARKEEHPAGGSVILGEGETVGHRHEILAPGVETYRRPDGFFLEVEETGVDLVHPEHERIALAPGTLEVIRQREFVRREFRPVQD